MESKSVQHRSNLSLVCSNLAHIGHLLAEFGETYPNTYP